MRLVLGLAATPGLTSAAQEAYDRLLEQRRRGEPDAPFSFADAEAASRAVVQDARGALAEGRRVSCAAFRRCMTSRSLSAPRACGAELGYRVNGPSSG